MYIFAVMHERLCAHGDARKIMRDVRVPVLVRWGVCLCHGGASYEDKLLADAHGSFPLG